MGYQRDQYVKKIQNKKENKNYFNLEVVKITEINYDQMNAVEWRIRKKRLRQRLAKGMHNSPTFPGLFHI